MSTTVDKRLMWYVLFGSIAFTSGFFIIHAIRSKISSAPITNWEAGLRLDAFWFACACGLGGALLGLASKTKLDAALMGLAALAGSMPVYYESSRIVSSVFEYQALDSPYRLAVTVLIQFVIIGAVTGAWLGSVQRSWTQVGWSALAGAVGFGLSAPVTIFLGPMAIGVFIGATLGWAFGLREVKQPRQSSPNEAAIQHLTRGVMYIKSLALKSLQLLLAVALGFGLGLLVWSLLISQGHSQGIIGMWKLINSLLPLSALLLVISMALNFVRGRRLSLELSVSSQLLLMLAFWAALVYIVIDIVRHFTSVQISLELIIYAAYMAVGLTAIVSTLVMFTAKLDRTAVLGPLGM
jgi:hypothetical protein